MIEIPIRSAYMIHALLVMGLVVRLMAAIASMHLAVHVPHAVLGA